MIVTTPEQRRRKLKTQKQHFKDWTLRSKKATCYGLQLYMLDPWSGFGEQVWIVGISYASRLTLSFPCKVVQVWLSVLFCCNSLMFLSCCRLQYFARGVQVYIKQLRAALQGKSGDALRTDEVCTTDIVCLLACMRVYVPLIHWASALASLTTYTLTEEISILFASEEISILFASCSVVFCLWLWMNVLL